MSSIIEQGFGVGDVICLLWFKRSLPRYCTQFIEIYIILCADHGPCVSGAHNAIVTTRAGKGLVSCLVSGYLQSVHDLGVLLMMLLATSRMLVTGVLLRAGKLEKTLVQMMVEGSLEGEEKAKTIVKEIMLYEVDKIIWNLLTKWIHESLHKGKEALQNGKEAETWNPKSKAKPIAQSAVELVKLAKTIMEQFFQNPIGITEDIVQELVNGLENLFQDYIMFVSACGTKQSYVPVIPSLTRCNRNSKFSMFLKKGCQCGGGGSLKADHISNATKEGHNPRPSSSRGTQCLYIRLNTLFYLLTHINSLEKTLSQNLVVLPSTRHPYGNFHRSYNNGSYFEKVLSSLPTTCQYMAEVAAYHLIFLDSDSIFYESLYVGDTANARIRHALRTLKQNITLMTTLLTDKAQLLALKEVMKASFEAFLRAVPKLDYHIVSKDFESLNRIFCLCREGLIAESVMDIEAAIVEATRTTTEFSNAR